ncbi:SARP family transcriptional regulator [Streptomyces sp. NPDC056503]|uniref:AfsR/SARP family transcriptional regulator n=1 Tax=Streptomyces sp. NPDC056503 TaxID=3345842 RepID=UPI0036986C72
MTSASDEAGAARAVNPPGGRHRPLSVALSGGFRLVLDGGAVELPFGAQRLVALLALRGRMGRSAPAGTLWPETEEQRALARLRTALWRVKQTVPELIVCAGSRIDLAPGVEVDVRAQIDRSMSVLHGTAVEPGSWTSVVPDGDLLPDWEDDWLTDDRERLRQLRLHVLEDLAEQFCAKGRFGLAVDAALTALLAPYVSPPQPRPQSAPAAATPRAASQTLPGRPPTPFHPPSPSPHRPPVPVHGAGRLV